ncbi:MAG: DUF4874 domain-containing protein [Lachnospiraceae bacterium]|jgi:hypothetical protein|nr:DUF4874 domain-containing protein [Lachnospiraceae bacterium]
MKRNTWKKYSKKAAAAIAALAVTAAGLLSAGTVVRSASNTQSYDFKVPVLAGEDSALLLSNPDRGLRMEVYLDVATGESLFEHAGEDAVKQLYDEIALYKTDQPGLIQVYFYLTGYKDKDLDEAAFARMNQYFEELEKNNLKAVLRFAYISDDTKPISQEPTTDRVVEHIKELKGFMEDHKEQIHVFQMGYIGAWGEWDGSARGRMEEKRIVDAVLQNTPKDMFIQVRYLNIKNNNVDREDTLNWNRVGYHDDFLIGSLHGWNTAGNNPASDSYQQMTRESANLLVDGEMIWGSANGAYTGGRSIDATLIAKRLKEHHFTSLSMTHNYKEKNTAYSMVDWQQEYVNQNILASNGLSCDESWFKDRNGNNLQRTMFEYIRDHLGYYLIMQNAKAQVTGKEVTAEITLKNDGFAAPLGLKHFQIVLLDTEGRVAAQQEGCPMKELQPGISKTVSAVLEKPDENRVYQLAVVLSSEGGEHARMANRVEYRDGYHILGEV